MNLDPRVAACLVPFEGRDIEYVAKAKGARPMPFVRHAAVTRRLLEVYGTDWSFEVVREIVSEAGAVVLVRLTCAGQAREQWGGAQAKSKMDLEDLLKSATSKAVRKAASLFGIGLHLWEQAPVRDDRNRAVKRAPEPTAPAPTTAEPPPPAGDRFPAHVEELIAAAKREGWTGVQLAHWVRDQFGVAFSSLTPAQARDALARLADLVARGPEPPEPPVNPVAAQGARHPGAAGGSISPVWPDHVKPLIAAARAENWGQKKLGHWTHREFGVAPAELTPEQAAEAQGRFAEQLREPPAPKAPEPSESESQTNLLKGLPPKFLNLMGGIHKKTGFSIRSQAEILMKSERLTFQQLAEKAEKKPKLLESFEGLCAKVHAQEKTAALTSPDGPGNTRGT